MFPNFQNIKIPTAVRYAVFIVFAAVYLWFKFSYHEMWKDEWQAWLMARDMGWGELLGALYYEGHPGLWYVYLKIWALFSNGNNDPFLLQASHAAIMLGVYYLLFFRFKIPFLIKVLLLLSFYPFFEYGMVSRGYALVMLLGFLIAIFIEKPEQNQGILAGLIFLFCQTEVYAVMIAGALLFYLILEKTGGFRLKKAFENSAFKKIAYAGLAGLLVFVISVFPRGSSEELSRAYLSEPFSGEIVFKGFQGMFANTFWIGSIPDTNVFGVSGVGVILSVVVLAGLIYFFRKEKNLLLTLLFFVVGYFIFLVSIYTGGVRQWGTFFIFFIILLQLFFSKKENKMLNIGQMIFLTSIFIFQIRYTALAVQKEYQYPFSNSKVTGEFIRKNIPENVPIVAINKFETAPVTAYAGRKFFALPSGEKFTYFKWVEKIYFPPEEELKLFAKYQKVGAIIIISPKKLDAARYPNAKLLENFTSYNIKNENYFLYRLAR